MANYDCTSRTSYFRTTNEEALKELVGKIASEDKVDLWEETVDGVKRFAFGSYGCITDFYNNPDDPDPQDVLTKLQELIPDDENVIVMEAGHEKLRYITGHLWVVTKTDIIYSGLTPAISNIYKELGKPVPKYQY